MFVILIFGILFSTTFSSSFADTQEQYDVIVVGAGIAGLAAADSLVNDATKKYNVLVLEASSREGGRVWTDNSLGTKLDLGASWIHGIDNNPIWEIAQNNNLEWKKTSEESTAVYDITTSPPTKIDDDSYMWALFDDKESPENDDDFMSYLKRYDKNGATLQDVIDDFIKQYNLDETQQKALNYTVYSEIEIDYATDASELPVSYKTGYRIDGQEDNDVILPGGYKQIIDILKKDLNIKTNTRVTEINYEGETAISVISSEGEIFKANRVIVAVPLGVLKKGEITFVPDLSQEKQTAIQHLEMGVMDKVYYIFDEQKEPFWDKDVDWIYPISKSRNHFSLFFNFYKSTGQPILLGFITGNDAKNLEELPEDQIMREGLEVLRQIYGDDISEPEQYDVTKWAKDQYTHGTYAYISKDGSLNDYAQLRESENNRIYFAGEHTDIHPQTVHGAYFSGKREAIKINLDDLKEEGKFMTPLEQENKGMHPYYIECKDGLELIIRTAPTQAACVTHDTATELIARNPDRSMSPEAYLESILF